MIYFIMQYENITFVNISDLIRKILRWEAIKFTVVDTHFPKCKFLKQQLEIYHWQQILSVVFLFFFFLRFYLFDREHKQGESTKRGSSRLPTERGAWYWGWIPGPWDHDLSHRCPDTGYYMQFMNYWTLYLKLMIYVI